MVGYSLGSHLPSSHSKVLVKSLNHPASWLHKMGVTELCSHCNVITVALLHKICIFFGGPSLSLLCCCEAVLCYLSGNTYSGSLAQVTSGMKLPRCLSSFLQLLLRFLVDTRKFCNSLLCVLMCIAVTLEYVIESKSRQKVSLVTCTEKEMRAVDEF